MAWIGLVDAARDLGAPGVTGERPVLVLPGSAGPDREPDDAPMPRGTLMVEHMASPSERPAR